MSKLAPRSLITTSLFLMALATPAIGCSDVGTHKLAIEGNDAVTAGIDALSTDGWAITFESFVVVVHDPGLIEGIDDAPAWVRETGVTVWDVASEPDVEDALSRELRASLYDGADFRIAPTDVSGREPAAGNVDTEVLDAAIDDGWSIHVVGSAVAGMQTITFDWTLSENTFYRCKFDSDDAVEIAADGEETSTIEILGDALFRSEVGNPDAALEFQPIADADADMDGMVTLDELDAAGLMDQVVSLSHELGSVRGAGPCPEHEG